MGVKVQACTVARGNDQRVIHDKQVSYDSYVVCACTKGKGRQQPSRI
jgi:hypothetical protein